MLFRITAITILAFSLAMAGAQEIEPITAGLGVPSAEAPGLEALWLGVGESTHGLPVTVTVLRDRVHHPGTAVDFRCRIDSVSPYENAVVVLAIHDGGKKPLLQESVTLDLLKGENSCTLEVDTSGLTPGRYRTTFEVIYKKGETPATYEVPMTYVTDAYFAQRLSDARARLRAAQVQLAAKEGGEKFSSNIAIRLRLAEDVGAEAELALTEGRWIDLRDYLAYLESASGRLTSELSSNGLPAELIGEVADGDLATLEIQDGNYFAGGRPVYLFGRAQSRPRVADIELLHRYGLNLSTLTVGPKDVLLDAESDRSIDGAYDAAFRAASTHNVTIAVQLAPHAVAPWMEEQWPDYADKGFVDLAHVGIRQSYDRLIDSVIPYLTKQEMVNSVSIAYEPRFRFDDEETEQAFIEHISAQYADAQDLNRLWHAKLANIEDIKIWSQEATDWFQERRAYQFDWQRFHMDLTTAYFGTVIDKIRGMAPDLMLQVTLTDGAFEEGETRFGVDREALIDKLDINGCMTESTPESDVYALNYPRPAAFYTLMRSMAPDKPVFDLQCDIQFDSDVSSDRIYDYVYTVVWEAVLNGVSAAVLPEDSPVFDNPWALEAFVTAALDINRLSWLVTEFQQAPVDVAVLFSNAAKVLDDGDPHLESAWFAYEGSSFGGYKIRFATEDSINAGLLDTLQMLILPQTPAVMDTTFERIAAYVDAGKIVARVGTPIPYNERGESRKDVLRHTGNTVLVRGLNLPTEYLHAMDAANVMGGLQERLRPISEHGYPVEGLKSSTITYEGEEYVYLVNLRKDPVMVNLSAGRRTGRDLLRGRDISFPTELGPLDPMLVRLNKPTVEDGPTKIRRRENIVKRYLNKVVAAIF